LTVFCISMATVIGPTPPGTGVILRTRVSYRGEMDVAGEPVAGFLGWVGTRLMPTSMTTAPGLTMSAVTNSGFADRGDEHVGLAGEGGQIGRPEWQMVTVALAQALRCTASRATGLPTMRLRPRTTTCLPLRDPRRCARAAP
jgi:hypothetical protein